LTAVLEIFFLRDLHSVAHKRLQLQITKRQLLPEYQDRVPINFSQFGFLSLNHRAGHLKQVQHRDQEMYQMREIPSSSIPDSLPT
jgi:hypothetical protein